MKTHLLEIRLSNETVHKNASNLWIVDWDGKYKQKRLVPEYEGGCKAYDSPVKLSDGETTAAAVQIEIKNKTDITSFGFPKKVWKKNGVGQCDAVLYPTHDKDEDAVLFIETKYSDSSNNLKEYKEKAIGQIKDTVKELLAIGCPLDHRNLYGLISFPLLLGNAVVFSPEELIREYEATHIQFMAGNRFSYESEKEVKLKG